MIGLIVLMMLYLGCQERIADKDIGSTVLNNLSVFKIFRLIETGSFQLATIGCV